MQPPTPKVASNGAFMCSWCGIRRKASNRCQCPCEKNGLHRRTFGNGPVCVSCCTHPPEALCTDCNRCQCTCLRCPYCRVRIQRDGLHPQVGEVLRPECDCCPVSPRRRPGTCNTCCGHQCCRVPIQMIGRPLVFWVPTIEYAKEPLPYERCSEAKAEEVLHRAVGSGRLNLRRFVDNPSRRFASVELEVAATRNAAAVNDICTTWSCPVVRDGSITPGGYEINTSPACGDALTQQLREILDALHVGESNVDGSCGTHIHLDARDYGYQDIQRLIRVWHRIEWALFAGCKGRRDLTRFCKPCGDQYYEVAVQKLAGGGSTPDLKLAIMEAAYVGTDVHGTTITMDKLLGSMVPTRTGRRSSRRPFLYQYRTGHRNGNRYNSLNLHSWFMRGTLENRMLHGSISYEEVWGWVKLHLELLDSVYAARNSDICSLTSDTNVRQIKKLASKTAIQQGLTVTDKTATGLMVLGELVSPESIEYLMRQIREATTAGTTRPARGQGLRLDPRDGLQPVAWRFRG